MIYVYGSFVSVFVFQSFRLSVSLFLDIESWSSGKESSNGKNGCGVLEKQRTATL